jgi:hypothetical protein
MISSVFSVGLLKRRSASAKSRLVFCGIGTPFGPLWQAPPPLATADQSTGAHWNPVEKSPCTAPSQQHKDPQEVFAATTAAMLLPGAPSRLRPRPPPCSGARWPWSSSLKTMGLGAAAKAGMACDCPEVAACPCTTTCRSALMPLYCRSAWPGCARIASTSRPAAPAAPSPSSSPSRATALRSPIRSQAAAAKAASPTCRPSSAAA